MAAVDLPWSTGMTDLYAQHGVNVSEADTGIMRIVDRLRPTWPSSGIGKVCIDTGYFANVIISAAVADWQRQPMGRDQDADLRDDGEVRHDRN